LAKYERYGLDTLALNPSEARFFAKAKGRGWFLMRHGWPDFLVERDGEFIGVEVKQTDRRFGADYIRANQAAMFSVLERAGIKVYVWYRNKPDKLEPWRKAYERQGKRNSRAERKARQIEGLQTAKQFREEFESWMRGKVG
jgi:hypothetical protein